MDKFKNSGNYQHFKGGKYKLVCNLTNAENQNLVLYKSEKSNSYWLREESIFFEMVTREGKTFKRFEKTANFTKEQSQSELEEFLLRMEKGEEIINEIDMEKYKLTKTNPLKVEKA